jgi:hypothetical protein
MASPGRDIGLRTRPVGGSPRWSHTSYDKRSVLRSRAWRSAPRASPTSGVDDAPCSPSTPIPHWVRWNQLSCRRSLKRGDLGGIAPLAAAGAHRRTERARRHVARLGLLTRPVPQRHTGNLAGQEMRPESSVGTADPRPPGVEPDRRVCAVPEIPIGACCTGSGLGHIALQRPGSHLTREMPPLAASGHWSHLRHT